MQVTSINIGQKRTQQNGLEIETTGIYKFASNEPVRITSKGIEEDFIANRKNHGGPDQAVYVYGAPDYEWWSGELAGEQSAGTFGENLTISELESSQVNIGDRLFISGVILEVTAPRIPCGTLAARMNDPHFVKRFRYAERPGFYCRVLQEGSVKAGDAVKIERYGTIPVTQIYRDYFDKNKSEETIQKYLDAPIAIRLRAILYKELQKPANQ